MKVHCIVVSLFALSITSTSVFAQSKPQSPPSAKPPMAFYLAGVTLAPVPDVLYHHVTSLPKGKGLVVQDVAANSLPARIGLRRNDILLRFCGQPVPGTGKQSNLNLLWALPANETCRVEILREGKPITLEYVLKEQDQVQFPKALVKPAGPPAVILDAQPLEDGKLKMILTYYAGVGGKLQSITCTGSVTEIENQVRHLNEQKKIPPRVQDLVDVALQRVRAINRAPAKQDGAGP